MGRISYAALLILRCGGKEREAKKKEWEELNGERGCGLCKEQDKFFLNSIYKVKLVDLKKKGRLAKWGCHAHLAQPQI